METTIEALERVIREVRLDLATAGPVSCLCVEVVSADDDLRHAGQIRIYDDGAEEWYATSPEAEAGIRRWVEAAHAL